jgi:hypothetical protein
MVCSSRQPTRVVVVVRRKGWPLLKFQRGPTTIVLVVIPLMEEVRRNHPLCVFSHT